MDMRLIYSTSADLKATSTAKVKTWEVLRKALNIWALLLGPSGKKKKKTKVG